MLETQNKSDTPNFEPVRVKQQVIICSSFPTLCLASWIETQVFFPFKRVGQAVRSSLPDTCNAKVYVDGTICVNNANLRLVFKIVH